LVLRSIVWVFMGRLRDKEEVVGCLYCVFHYASTGLVFNLQH
jgi:hypothetical protein